MRQACRLYGTTLQCRWHPAGRRDGHPATPEPGESDDVCCPWGEVSRAFFGPVTSWIGVWVVDHRDIYVRQLCRVFTDVGTSAGWTKRRQHHVLAASPLLFLYYLQQPLPFSRLSSFTISPHTTKRTNESNVGMMGIRPTSPSKGGRGSLGRRRGSVRGRKKKSYRLLGK